MPLALSSLTVKGISQDKPVFAATTNTTHVLKQQQAMV